MKLFAQAVAVASVLAVSLACGGGSAGPSSPTPTPVPTPTPAPAPTPTPCPDGACSNSNAPVRVTLKLYLMWDPAGKLIEPTPDPVRQVLEQPVRVGSKIRFDVVGKDANEKETNGQKNITYIYGEGRNLVEDIGLREDGFQKDVKVAAPGQFSIYVVFDGVASNSITFTFVP
jgi:hypothetical protein